MTPARVIVLALAVVSGCASDGKGNGTDPGSPGTCQLLGGAVTGNEMVGRFDYSVTGGFTGGGDGTSMEIDGNGFVTRHTTQHGTETGLLDQPTLEDLVAKTRGAQFPTLCAMYACAGCGDDLVHKVSVQLDRIPYTVQVSEFATPPARLQAMLDALDMILARPLN